jgi:hypothetical protein
MCMYMTTVDQSSIIIDDNKKDHSSYHNFIYSIKSIQSQKIYEQMIFKYYLSRPENNCLTLNDLLKKESRTIEHEIINIITKDMKNLSYSSIHVFLAAITHFFEINDVLLNKKNYINSKVKTFLN